MKAHCLKVDRHHSVLGNASAGRGAYTPFGAIPRAGYASLGFNGQLTERCTGAYLLGHGKRLYAPGTARFASADQQSPFGRGGLNAYVYCLGDPTNRVDPGGEASVFTLVKNTVWVGARLKAALSKPRGLKALQEAARWGARGGGALAAVGVPGAAAVASASAAVGIAVKGAHIANALLNHAGRHPVVRRVAQPLNDAWNNALVVSPYGGFLGIRIRP